jgi:[protein-PII] uridylyltransferase
MCDVILPRLGFTTEETADARALVLEHLTMYHLATRRDLDDPATVGELCRVVRGRGGLRDLYLLTIADITTTSPTAMTSWKAHMLEELFLRADARLAERSVASRVSPGVSGAQPLTMTLAERSVASQVDIDAERVAVVSAEVWRHDPDGAAFVASMPMRYLLATPPLSIATHARVARERRSRVVAVGLGPTHPSRADSEVCVVARDRPGLLARIAAALAASRLEVSAAHVHTRACRDGREAVDVFFVRGLGGPESVERKVAAVERDLIELCEDRISASELLAKRLGEAAPWAARKTPDVRTRVVFDECTSPHATIIEVIAKDEPGLLFRLARALEEASLGITFSKINTEGTKVADVFYVQELDGRKVEGKTRLDDIRRRLIEKAR